MENINRLLTLMRFLRWIWHLTLIGGRDRADILGCQDEEIRKTEKQLYMEYTS